VSGDSGVMVIAVSGDSGVRGVAGVMGIADKITYLGLNDDVSSGRRLTACERRAALNHHLDPGFESRHVINNMFTSTGRCCTWRTGTLFPP